MYLPEVFNVIERKKIVEFIENNSFADLISCRDNVLCSNKVPLFFDKENNVLLGHFGRENPQLIDMSESDEVLVVFSGLDTYVSPQWYASEAMVPTWNFQTLQVRGKARIVSDNRLIEILERLSEFHESGLERQWTMRQLDEKRKAMMLQMITGFEIEIKDIKFKEKMSQNRSAEDQQSVIKSLSMQESHEKSEVAELMRENLETAHDL